MLPNEIYELETKKCILFFGFANLQISSFSKNGTASKQSHPDEALMLKTSASLPNLSRW